jgi:hypothetical protein
MAIRARISPRVRRLTRKPRVSVRADRTASVARSPARVSRRWSDLEAVTHNEMPIHVAEQRRARERTALPSLKRRSARSPRVETRRCGEAKLPCAPLSTQHVVRAFLTSGLEHAAVGRTNAKLLEQDEPAAEPTHAVASAHLPRRRRGMVPARGPWPRRPPLASASDSALGAWAWVEEWIRMLHIHETLAGARVMRPGVHSSI